MRSFWTKEKDESLIRLIDQGYSARQAAEELGSSRNACIGRAFRLNLHFSGNKENKKEIPLKSKSFVSSVASNAPMTKIQTNHSERRHVTETTPGIRISNLQPIKSFNQASTQGTTLIAPPTCEPVDFLDLRNDTCRFPIGDPRHESFGYCGAPSLVGKPYCNHHHRIAYVRHQPSVSRKKNGDHHGARVVQLASN